MLDRRRQTAHLLASRPAWRASVAYAVGARSRLQSRGYDRAVRSSGASLDRRMNDHDSNDGDQDETAGPRGLRWGLWLGLLFWALMAVIFYLLI